MKIVLPQAVHVPLHNFRRVYECPIDEYRRRHGYYGNSEGE